MRKLGWTSLSKFRFGAEASQTYEFLPQQRYSYSKIRAKPPWQSRSLNELGSTDALSRLTFERSGRSLILSIPHVAGFPQSLPIPLESHNPASVLFSWNTRGENHGMIRSETTDPRSEWVPEDWVEQPRPAVPEGSLLVP